MKKSFNPETLIIPGFILIIVAFISLLALAPLKPEKIESNKFVGIDAVGIKHGSGPSTTIKYH